MYSVVMESLPNIVFQHSVFTATCTMELCWPVCMQSIMCIISEVLYTVICKGTVISVSAGKVSLETR